MKFLTTKLKPIFFGALLLTSFTMALSPVNVNAQGTPPNNGCDTHFLGTIPAWYNGVNNESGDGCDIASPNDVGGIGPFIWIIVLNIVELLLVLAGYAAVLFIIYGGYKYMTSAGSSDGVASAKRTITNAVIGLVISIAAVAIVRTISSAVGLVG